MICIYPNSNDDNGESQENKRNMFPRIFIVTSKKKKKSWPKRKIVKITPHTKEFKYTSTVRSAITTNHHDVSFASKQKKNSTVQRTKNAKVRNNTQIQSFPN